MLRVLACITQEHNWWLLALAALICAVTSVSGFLMLERAIARRKRVGGYWAVAAGIVAGLGVWATHFVAMTAYDVRLPLGFTLAPLFGSLLLSLAAQTAALWCAYKFDNLRLRALAGAASGVGITAMHYLGMTGLEAAALMQWDAGLVAASVFLSVLLASVALTLFFASTQKRRWLHAGGLLVAAIFALHFTGMSALTLVPTGEARPDGISQTMLGVIVGFAALLCLIFALAAALADFYHSDRQRLENARLRDMVAERTAELVALAEQQAELTARAEEASAAKSRFIANMSHELRTPLNAIIGYGEIISEDATDEQAAEDAQRIVVAARHLLKIISDILDLSKAEAGRIELELMDFSVAQLVNETIDAVAPVATANDVKLKPDLGPGLGEGRSDGFKIKQCLLNLLSNAVKFSAGGQVTLRARREQCDGRDWLLFDVCDTGIGMSAEELERLFRPFMQADASVTRRFGGTGLGLVITRQFAQLMGGDVTVKSEIGKGSTFTLYVPASAVTADDELKAA